MFRWRAFPAVAAAVSLAVVALLFMLGAAEYPEGRKAIQIFGVFGGVMALAVFISWKPRP